MNARWEIIRRFISIAGLCGVHVLPLNAALNVATNFESASARVLSIDADTQTVRISPAGNPDRGWPCWWYLRVDGIDTTRPLTLEVVASGAMLPPSVSKPLRPLAPAWALPNRAAISTNGTTWNQTPPAERKNRTATYRIPAPAATLWLAWGPPFSRGDAVEFCESMAGRYSFVSSFSLVHSTEGRSVPALRIAEGETNASQRAGIWILARQHAWEAGGTWVGIGIAEWLASNDPRAQSMRRNAEFFFVPVMDPDHVATGDGGKECLPQDQNRDWSDAPHWPEVAAVQKHVRSLVKEGRMDLLIDLHNPGAAAREVDLWITPTNLLGAVQGRNQTKLFAAIRAEVTSPIRAKAEPHWDGPSPDHPATWHTLSCPWVYEHGNPHTVAITVETPWNMPAGTTTGYREVGRKLGLAIERYLRERERR